MDAKSLDMEIIGTGDTSQKIICAAIYARVEKRDFCKIESHNRRYQHTMSRTYGSCTKCYNSVHCWKTLESRHTKTLKLTDSQVALYWICSKRTSLKTWVCNKVIEINRLCDSSSRRYVESSNMVADIGTRK